MNSTTASHTRSTSPVHFTQSGEDSALSDTELVAKYKEIINTTTLYYRIRHITRAADWAFNAVENTVYSNRLSQPLEAPIFPLGNFRSGTSFLEKVISDHVAVGYFTYTSQIFPRSPLITRAAMRRVPALNTPMLPIHMPDSIDALSPYEGEPVWRWCRNNPWTDSDNNVLDREFSDPAFERLLHRVINKHLISQGKSRFINKNPWNTLRVGYLSRLYPDARFVYITRHPYRMLRSQIDLERIHERTLGHLRHFNEVFSDQFASPRVFFRTPDSASYIKLYEQDKLLATAKSIVDFDACFELQLVQAGLSDKVYRVRYEDLLASFSSEMEAIFKHLDLYDANGKVVIADNEKHHLRKDLVSAGSALPTFTPEVEDVLAPMVAKYEYIV